MPLAQTIPTHVVYQLLEDRHWATALRHSLKPILTVVGNITRLMVGLPSVSSGQALTHITALISEPVLMPIPKMRTLRLGKTKVLPKVPQLPEAGLEED